MFNRKRQISSAHVTRKEFSYEKNGTRLSFTLRLDVKTELNSFAELLERALADVKAEIGK